MLLRPFRFAGRGVGGIMDMKTIGMISLIVSGAALIFVEVKKRTTFARLEHNLGERDFDACLALLNQPITKALYSEYNRLYMSLNAYLALGDNENSTRVIERMLPLRMNKKQELALAIRAFSFYVEVEDKKTAHDMLKRREVSGSEALAKGRRETYDIFLCGNDLQRSGIDGRCCHEHAHTGCYYLFGSSILHRFPPVTEAIITG